MYMKNLKSILMVIIACMICCVATMPAEAQTKMPSKMYLTGTVNYSYGHDRAQVVKSALELELKNGSISGYITYEDECYVEGTYKLKKDGTYYMDVYLIDNSGCDFEGTYNPKTGVFSGGFTAKGLSKSYPFKFTKSK